MLMRDPIMLMRDHNMLIWGHQRGLIRGLGSIRIQMSCIDQMYSCIDQMYSCIDQMYRLVGIRGSRCIAVQIRWVYRHVSISQMFSCIIISSGGKPGPIADRGTHGQQAATTTDAANGVTPPHNLNQPTPLGGRGLLDQRQRVPTMCPAHRQWPLHPPWTIRHDD